MLQVITVQCQQIVIILYCILYTCSIPYVVTEIFKFNLFALLSSQLSTYVTILLPCYWFALKKHHEMILIKKIAKTWIYLSSQQNDWNRNGRGFPGA